MDPQKITELANLLRNNGDKILSSEFKLTLSGSLLRALNDSFTLIAESTEICAPKTSGVAAFQVVKPINSKSPVFRDLQLVHDFVQKTTLLCIVHYAADDYFDGAIDISKFRALKRLEVQKTNVMQIVGLRCVRSQIEHLICMKSLRNVDEIITRCGGDNSNGFVWNELKIADFSYNNLQTVDSSLEFAQYLQHLNLRHNQLHSVEAVKWLPHLKSLDLSYNRLTGVPQLHMDACKRLQSLNMSNNFVEDLMGLSKWDALTDLDLSDNCLMDHTYLLPLSSLICLKFLNLYGNPLYFHPKHRLATAQFLHKNTSTVKFILDFEPLSKSEKAITGSQQMRHATNRYNSQSSSINVGRPTPPGSMLTPASSVGSLRSFKFRENSECSDLDVSTASSSTISKKKSGKVRTVDIGESFAASKGNVEKAVEPAPTAVDSSAESDLANGMTRSVIAEEQNTSTELLEKKKQIEDFRQKHGDAWLHTGIEDMMNSVLGVATSPPSTSQPVDLFNDYIASGMSPPSSKVDISSAQASNLIPASTPIEESTLVNTFEDEGLVSPVKQVKSRPNSQRAEDSLYVSLNQTNGETHYETATNLTHNGESLSGADEDEKREEGGANIKYPFSSTDDAEDSEASEPEHDEVTYIVFSKNENEDMLLTLSQYHLRERDVVTKKTKAKWSLKILESCDRLKSNTIRINYDTLRSDKQERIYTVLEDGLCQELEKKLRHILSTRDLSEMNQTVYRCVQCSCQFLVENKRSTRGKSSKDVQCPDCKSAFIAEIQNIPKATEASKLEERLSPAAIVGESPLKSPTGLQSDAAQLATLPEAMEYNDDTNSIGSANSLNESSSCSKLSTRSQGSFDSNQSVVGSSNTDRDNGFKSNDESDVDILSNPSQSSIEVLDHISHSSRKTSEERRISQIPNLETIDDLSFNETTRNISTGPDMEQRVAGAEAKGPLAQFQLTESSSSGSVTDSICTTYEQQGSKALVKSETRNGDASKKDESGISSIFGALFQSTNILMSSSKKLIDVESSASIQTGTALPKSSKPVETSVSDSCRPYKFNYTNFSDIDHRLKLYFYQTKFDDPNEHFQWIARGHLYNQVAGGAHFDGVVVLSTCKCYVLEAYAPEHDDVTKWLRHVVSVTVDRVACVQLLPWKLGFRFELRDWGEFVLLLKDIERTNSLLMCFTNNTLPQQCDLSFTPSEILVKRLNRVAGDEKLKMCCILDGCEVSCDTAKRSFSICAMFVSEGHLYLSSDRLDWLSVQWGENVEVCLTQYMSNLVDVDRVAENCFVINFLDETHGKCELWRCSFETKESADSCLSTIGQSWEKLFGVPLIGGA